MNPTERPAESVEQRFLFPELAPPPSPPSEPQPVPKERPGKPNEAQHAGSRISRHGEADCGLLPNRRLTQMPSFPDNPICIYIKQQIGCEKCL